MNKTREDGAPEKYLAVNIENLQRMLNLGRGSADSIGEQAGAVIRVGKRKLYNVSKIQKFIDENATIAI